jgi:hypothetical protein
VNAPSWLRRGALGTILVLPMTATAQSSGVLLQIRPHAGDTLRVRLDQTVEMTGMLRSGEPAMSESSSLVVLTRLHVEDADLDGVTILAHTDSVRLVSAPNSATGTMLAWARAAQGHRFRFRVTPDGSTSPSKGNAWGSPQPGALLTQMPATLPRRPIAPGATWSSAMEVPMAGSVEAKGTAMLTATFRFDSLSRSGELAFLSIQGRLSRSASGRREGETSVVETSGTVTGTVLVDRRRGWITDARTTVVMRSLVIPSAKDKPPMRVQVTISQWMRAM